MSRREWAARTECTEDPAIRAVWGVSERTPLNNRGNIIRKTHSDTK